MNYEKLPKTISAEELLSTPLPPVKWIIPDLLPAGLALFAGPSKAGKSWLTLWLCLQVAQGKPMWGREIEPHTVLYLSLEDTFNRLQKRLLQLVGSEEAPERLVMQTECSSIGQGLEEQLTSFLYQHPDTGLIVIDVFVTIRTAAADLNAHLKNIHVSMSLRLFLSVMSWISSSVITKARIAPAMGTITVSDRFCIMLKMLPFHACGDKPT